MRPEIKLLLCCLNANVDERTTVRIHELFHKNLDWTFLVEVALYHQIVPLFYRGLASVEGANVPDDIATALQLFCDRRKERNQTIFNELISIIDALNERAIDVIPFKGPTLGMQAYNSVDLRVFNDLDFLIHERDYTAALDIFRKLGYHNEEWKTPLTSIASWRFYGQDILFNKEAHAAIEPHWLFAPRSFAININFDSLWERAGTLRINGLNVIVLSPEDHLLVICVHGCKEQWIYLRQVCDVASLIQNNPKLDWELLCQYAQNQNCSRMLLIGLGLANHLLDIELPSDIEKKIKRDKTAALLAQEAYQWLIHERRPIPDIYKVNRFRLRMRERWQDRIQYVFRTWFMPSDKHFRMVIFPPMLIWLYVPTKLIHDYLLLPLWMLGKRIKKSRATKSQVAGRA